jgi:hypothetical protein
MCRPIRGYGLVGYSGTAVIVVLYCSGGYYSTTYYSAPRVRGS